MTKRRETPTEETCLEDCDLSIRLKKLLSSSNVLKVKDLLEIDKNYLMRYRGLGMSSYKELIEFVNKNGFEFNN